MKPWEDPARFLKWSVFEREARMNAVDNQPIFGPLNTKDQATEALEQHFGNSDNYYVKQHDIREYK